jgi:protein-S-isoprenylcysteine O-methyltransferase Ste14
MTHFGIISILWSDGGWMRDCVALGAIGEVGVIGGALIWGVRVLAVYFTVWNVTTVFALLLRAPREDLTLKEKFGKEWEAYREKVPWRFVPYVI